ncbi:hypothetical protein EPICR_50022 [Candidatus Desulfarcum epimagneticum]|uniref:Uncharacterized protein n=1 Tax=uncultured Desulfobacteraceae bacterium TaxID=218296 RepID=A0A484HJ18_9BACT|nr:hypothetical protein EPICR_50022 [uncultured Desulfobacteraceae bacterium]
MDSTAKAFEMMPNVSPLTPPKGFDSMSMGHKHSDIKKKPMRYQCESRDGKNPFSMSPNHTKKDRQSLP